MNGVDIVWPEFARTLERELAETERLRFGADADRRRLRCELSDAKAECERLKANQRQPAEEIFVSHLCDELARLRAELASKTACYDIACGEVQRLRAEVERLNAQVELDDKAKLFLVRLNRSDRIRAEKAEASLAAIEEDGTEEHNAAVGLRQKLVAALDRAMKAEAECLEQARLLGMSGEREADLLGKLGRLESELAAIKHGHGELGKYEQLRLKNAELQAELANIANAKPDTWGDMSDSFQAWAQNRARHALAAIKGTP
jgi:chromosome segregation ATPase